MENELKLSVIQQLLKLVQIFVPLRKARIATLGGEGWEARIWQEFGIPGENAWLIERKRTASKRLIADSPYRYHSNLKSLPTVVRSIYGADAGLDFFHLDLCGTLEPSLEQFRPVVPLFARRGRGRCLAVTVADQRRNSDLEQHRSLRTEVSKVLGRPATSGFLESLLAEQQLLPCAEQMVPFVQQAEPVKGAKREFGVYYHMLRLLENDGVFPALPDRIERFMYVSTYRGYPFRMRTYFFHFADQQPPLDYERGAAQLVNAWQQSYLCFFRDGTLIQVPKTNHQEIARMAYDELSALAKAAGGKCLEQFEQLVAQVNRERAAIEILLRIQKEVAEFNGAGYSSPAPEKSISANDEPVPNVIFGNGEKLKAQLDLLRAKAKGGEAFAEVSEALKRRLAGKRRITAQSRKTLNHQVGSYYALTHGKFRGKFVRVAVSALADAAQVPSLLKELSELYAKIGEPVSVEDLKQEAGI